MPALLTRLLAVLTAVLVAAAVAASPAGAHAGDIDQATNYQTRLTGTPDLPGLTVRLADAGRTIEVTYTGPGELVVQGYADEPYLRIGSDGVLENRQSPATYLNASLTADVVVPEEVDPHAPPEWRHVRNRPSARWHDHRAHWMGVADPPAVTADPDRVHVVVDGWRIPLELDDGGAGEPVEAEITGDIVWVPGPRPVGWLVTLPVLGIAGGLLAALRPRALTGVVIAAAACAGTALVLAVGPSPVPPPRWWTATTALAAVALGTASIRIGRAPGLLATALAVAGGLVLGLVVGWGDRAWLVRSSLPVDAPTWLGRGVVAAALVLGGVVVLGAGLRLLGRGQPMRALWPPSTGMMAPVTKADSSEAR